MNPEQKTFFQANGYLHLQRCLARSQVDPVRRRILDELKRRRIWSGGKSLSRLLRDTPTFQQVGKLGQLLKFDDLHKILITGKIQDAMSALAEQPLPAAQEAQLLLSLPNQGEWRLDGLNWHVDIGPAQADRLPGVQAFVLIDDVRPRGGATLAIAGSHRLKDGILPGGGNIRRLLNEAQDIEPALRRSGLSMVEMAGAAGDVYLMDMRVLHTPSINATPSLRMMATARCYCR